MQRIGIVNSVSVKSFSNRMFITYFSIFAVLMLSEGLVFSEGIYSKVLPIPQKISLKIENELSAVILKSVSHKDKVLYASNGINIIHLLKNVCKIYYNPKLIYHDFEYFVNYKPIDVYILSISSPSIIEQIKKQLEWNSRAKFIIYYQHKKPADKENTMLYDLFKYLAENFIYNVVVVTDIKAYSYHPYKYENFNNPDLQPFIIKDDTYFSDQLPKTWRNTTLNILALVSNPYIFINKETDQQPDGLDYRLTNDIMKSALKFERNYIFDFESSYGTLQRNGSYTMFLGRIQNKEGDFGMAGIPLSHPMNVYFDVSYPVNYDKLLWVVPAPALLPHSTNLIRICTPKIWLLLLLTLIIISAFWLLLCKCVKHEHPHYKDDWEATMMPLKFLLNQVGSYNPNSYQIKIVYVFTWIFVVLISTALTANLIEVITHPARAKPIKTVQDIIDRHLKISIPHHVALIYLNYGTESGRIIYERNNPVDKIRYLYRAIVAVGKKRDVVSISSDMFLEYLYINEGLIEDGTQLLQSIDEIFYTISIPHYFVRGHPIFPRYNEVMNWIRASGIYRSFHSLIKHDWNIKQRVVEETRLYVLTLSHLALAFVLLICGYILTSVAFLIELMMNSIKKTRVRERNLFYKSFIPFTE